MAVAMQHYCILYRQGHSQDSVVQIIALLLPLANLIHGIRKESLRNIVAYLPHQHPSFLHP